MDPDGFKRRNRILCAMLMIFGLINFSCIVREKDLNDAEKIWVSASFFMMVGAAMTLLLQGIDYNNKYALYTTAFILFAACILAIAAAGRWVDKYCGNNHNECELYAFGAVVLPSLVTVVVIIDLFTAAFMKEKRVRLCIFTTIIFTSSILLSCHYYEMDKLDDNDRTTAAAFTILMGISAIVFLTHGMFGLDKLAWLNFGISFIFSVGIFLLLVNDLACVSTALVWWFLLCSVVYLILEDVAFG